jgi:polyhydroxybutyrate depolymerase
VDRAGRFPGWSLEAEDTNKDLRFFDALFKEVVRQWHPETKQVFAMGHSNGGAFIYTLWAARGTLFAGFGSMEAAGARRYSLMPKPIFVTIGSQDQIVKPLVQHTSFNAVLKVNQAPNHGMPFGDKGALYKGLVPTVLWEYNGTHTFPRECVPSLISFFKSLLKD